MICEVTLAEGRIREKEESDVVGYGGCVVLSCAAADEFKHSEHIYA